MSVGILFYLLTIGWFGLSIFWGEYSITYVVFTSMSTQHFLTVFTLSYLFGCSQALFSRAFVSHLLRGFLQLCVFLIF